MDCASQSDLDFEEEDSKALAHFRKLEATFSEAIKGVCNGAISVEEAFANLSKLEEDISGVGSYLSDHLETRIYNLVKKKDSTVASQIFTIPELVELILSFTCTPDLLNMQRVDKTVNSIIESSPRLQIALGLKPDDKVLHNGSTYYSPLASVKSPSVKVYAFNRLRITFKNSGALPTFGSRIRNILIAQPPVKIMAVQRRCARCLSKKDEDTLSSDTGITMGDLYARAKEEFAAPTLCSRCYDYNVMRSSTLVTVTETKEVTFRASQMQNDPDAEDSFA